MTKKLSLLGIDLTANNISVSREYASDDKITMGVRIVYSEERAAIYSLAPRSWARLNQNQAERVRGDMRSLGLGSSIPKKEYMWSSAILPGSVELAHVNRKFSEPLVGTMKMALDHLAADVLRVHNIKCVFMYIVPASVQHLNKHPPCKALHAYAGDPAAVGSDFDMMIRQALARQEPRFTVSSTLPTPSRPIGLPPKPSFIETPTMTNTSSTSHFPSTASSSIPSRNERTSAPSLVERSSSGSLKRPHSVVTAELGEEGGRAKVRKIDVEQGELPTPRSAEQTPSLSRRRPTVADLEWLARKPSSPQELARPHAGARHLLGVSVPHSGHSDVPGSSTSGTAAPSHNAISPMDTMTAEMTPSLSTIRPATHAMFIPKTTQRDTSTGTSMPLTPPNDVPQSEPAGFGTHRDTLISAAALGRPASTAIAHKLKTLQDERDAAVNYAREQSIKLDAAQTQLVAQRAELVEMASLRKEIARLQELYDERVQIISTLSRARQTMTEEVRVRGERLKALSLEVAEVPQLRAKVQELEAHVRNADALRRELAQLEPLRNVAADLTSSRARVQQLRVDAANLLQQRDTALSELAKAQEDKDKLQGDLVELQTLRTRVQELAPFRDKAKILLQLAQKLRADQDVLRVQCQQQETELQSLRTQAAEVDTLQGQMSALESRVPLVEGTEESLKQTGETDQCSVLARLTKLVEHEGNFSRDDINTVLEAVERKTETLEAAERTADIMCGRALRAEKKAAGLESRLKALESANPVMVPTLTEALMQIADLAAGLTTDAQ